MKAHGNQTYEGRACVISKRIGLDISEINSGISLIYNKKSKGPCMEPCGTPSLTDSHLKKCSLGLLSIITLWNLFFK